MIDSWWEGDDRTWIGCYAHLKGRPVYWADPVDEKSIPKDGIDYSEWFEWYIRIS